MDYNNDNLVGKNASDNLLQIAEDEIIKDYLQFNKKIIEEYNEEKKQDKHQKAVKIQKDLSYIKRVQKQPLQIKAKFKKQFIQVNNVCPYIKESYSGQAIVFDSESKQNEAQKQNELSKQSSMSNLRNQSILRQNKNCQSQTKLSKYSFTSNQKQYHQIQQTYFKKPAETIQNENLLSKKQSLVMTQCNLIYQEQFDKKNSVFNQNDQCIKKQNHRVKSATAIKLQKSKKTQNQANELNTKILQNLSRNTKDQINYLNVSLKYKYDKIFKNYQQEKNNFIQQLKNCNENNQSFQTIFQKNKNKSMVNNLNNTNIQQNLSMNNNSISNMINNKKSDNKITKQILLNTKNNRNKAL